MLTFWSIAASAYALTAFGGIALFFAVMRLAPKGTATRLLGATLVSLIYHYFFFAFDAFLRSQPAPVPEYTLWAGAGQAMLFSFWALLCWFLFVVIRPRLARPAETLNVTASVVIVCAVAAIGIFHSARLIWTVSTGANPQPALTGLMHAGRSTGIFFVLPITFLLQAPGRLDPDRPTFPDWHVGNLRISLITLRIFSPRPRPSGAIPLSIPDFRALSAAVATGLAVYLLCDLSSPQWLLATRLSLIISVFGVVYFQTRFTFFDLILKRGIASLILALAVGLFSYLTPILQPSQKAVFCIGATVFTSLWGRISYSSEQTLDRLIFRRPNYQQELSRLTLEMARSSAASGLAALVGDRLRDLLHVNSVEYSESPLPNAVAVIRIGSPDHPRGFLSLGERDRAQPYRSEDLTFLDAVAAQFSAQMQTLAAQRATELAADAEIRALRAQINPHFLFNTLNTAAEMAQSSPAVEHLILNLAHVFRNTLQASLHERVSLREDLAAIRALLEIESTRFDGRLTFAIDAAEETLDLPLPPLLIQPIVENAVRHGITPKLGPGHIQIRAEKTPSNALKITIADDGIGFNPEAVATNVGLSNVQSRIEHEGGAFTVHSAPGEGTTVSFEWKPTAA